MEIYAKLGIVDRALELGKLGTGANIWAQGRKMARVPLGEAGPERRRPYPFILILGQDDNERIMGDKLRDLGVSVQWNTELVGLEQEPGPGHGNAEDCPTARTGRLSPRGSPDATARTAPCAS